MKKLFALLLVLIMPLALAACGGKEGTERALEAEGKNGSAVLGKFRDVNALAEAYGALEAEFTRRSQRLRELEKRA